jgi:hypothetical protein
MHHQLAIGADMNIQFHPITALLADAGGVPEGGHRVLEHWAGAAPVADNERALICRQLLKTHVQLM